MDLETSNDDLDMQPVIVKLDIGGVKFKTTKQTLKKYPDSMLGRMFTSEITPHVDDDGYIFFDANGEMFKYVLQFLRNNSLDVPENFSNIKALESVITYFHLPEMMVLLEEWKLEKFPPPMKKQLIEVIATKQGMDEYEDFNIIHRWVYTKDPNNIYFMPVLLDEGGKDSGRRIDCDESADLIGEMSHFCKLVRQESYTNHASVLSMLDLLNVKDFDKSLDFDKELYKNSSSLDIRGISADEASYVIKVYEAM